MKKHARFYLLQAIFWVLFAIYAVLPNYLAGYESSITSYSIDIIAIILTGFIDSSIYKHILDKIKIDYSNLKQIIPAMIIGCLVCLVIYQAITYGLYYKEITEAARKIKVPLWRFSLTIVLSNVVITIPWFLIFHFYMYVQRNFQIQKKLLDNENKMKQLQIENMVNKLNPHFLFNSLNTIKWLVNKNTQEARAAIDSLSDILRYNIQDAVPIKTLAEELWVVEKYLSIEKIRFDEMFTYKIAVEENLYKCPIIPFVLLNVVENAIKHGISKSISEGFIHISIFQKAEMMHIEVQNTGNLQKGSTNSGFGLESVRQLLETRYGEQCKMDISQVAENQVLVNIIYPKNVK
jgi:sensor histidine kinase YesM